MFKPSVIYYDRTFLYFHEGSWGLQTVKKSAGFRMTGVIRSRNRAPDMESPSCVR